MKHSILVTVFISLFTVISYAQDPCSISGGKNSMGMDMTVSKISVTDPTNFLVSSVKPLPFTLKKSDTLWVDVCSFASDGKNHSAQVQYTTNMGMQSFVISTMAPMAKMQVVSEKNPHPMNIQISKIWVDDSTNFYALPPQTLPYTVANGGTVSFNLYLMTMDGLPHTAKISFATDMGTFTTSPTTMTASMASVPETNLQSGIKAFPNPANSQVTIQLPGENSKGNLELYSISGQKVFSSNVSTSKVIEIPVKELAVGVYIVKFIPTDAAPIEISLRVVR